MKTILWAIALSACASNASAQTEVIARSEAQRLACLVKPAEPLKYPQIAPQETTGGLLRVRLRFSKPDARPEVELLANSAREDMRMLILGHVAQYRLPCLRPEDGEVSAVQEFQFHNSDRDPVPLAGDAEPGKEPPCIVRPRLDMTYPERLDFGVPRAEHVIVVIRFAGDPKQPPEVSFRYSNASVRMEEMVRAWAVKFRMPCRKADDQPVTFEQLVTLSPPQRARYAFPQERFTLRQFLGLTREPSKLVAKFDLKTMACPFKVDFWIGLETVPHRATVRGPEDPNRAVFLRWLETLQFNFASEEMAYDVFGAVLQIDVPCGRIDLKGQPAMPAG